MKNVLELRKAYAENLKKVSPIFSSQCFDEVELHDFGDFGFASTNELDIDAYEFAKAYMSEKYWELFEDIEFTYELKSEKTWSYGVLKFPKDVEMENKYFFTGMEYLYRLGYESIQQIGDKLLGERRDTASYKDFIDENFYRIFKFEL